MAANSSNDFMLDRELMRSDLYLGILGNPTQDAAVQASMGPIYDRTNEHLGTTDAAIIRVRRCLIEVTRTLQERGTAPPGVDLHHPPVGGGQDETRRVRPDAFRIPEEIRQREPEPEQDGGHDRERGHTGRAIGEPREDRRAT